MIAVALALLLSGQAAPAAPATVQPEAAPAPETTPAAIAANLADMYEKSCGGRIYGTYADACNTLADQLKKARAAAKKAERDKARNR